MKKTTKATKATKMITVDENRQDGRSEQRTKYAYYVRFGLHEEEYMTLLKAANVDNRKISAFCKLYALRCANRLLVENVQPALQAQFLKQLEEMSETEKK